MAMREDAGMKEFYLQGEAKSGFARAIDYVNVWCSQHQWQVGVAEMSLGAGILAAGLQTGALQIGVDVVLTAFAKGTTAKLFGAGAGAALGLLPGFLLGNIGVVAMGAPLGVPALALMGGGGRSSSVWQVTGRLT